MNDQAIKSNLVIRDRAYVALNAVKYPDYIPASEIRQAILMIVSASASISVNECSKEVSKILGTGLERGRMKCRVVSEAKSMADLGLIDSHEDILNRLS